MKNNYVNLVSEREVIGNIFVNPSLLEQAKYSLIEEDFSSDLNRTLYNAISLLYTSGVTKIEIKDIENFLENKEKSKAVFDYHKGREFLESISETASISSFDYYYGRLKKFSLMRAFSKKLGMDLTWLYDPDLFLDTKRFEEQDKWLDETPLAEISDLIAKKIEEVKGDEVEQEQDRKSVV